MENANARQLAVFGKIIEQRDENFAQLLADGFGRCGGSLNHPEPAVMRLVDQRLEQRGLVAKMIIQRRLGDLRVADDLLDGRGRVAGVGEMLQRRPQNMRARFQNGFRMNNSFCHKPTER